MDRHGALDFSNPEESKRALEERNICLAFITSHLAEADSQRTSVIKVILTVQEHFIAKATEPISENRVQGMHLTWDQAKKHIVNECSFDDIERQSHMVKQLVNIKMHRGDLLSNCTYRFQKMRRDADAEDDRVIANLYLNTLVPKFIDRVTLAIAGLPASKTNTVTKLSYLARRVANNQEDGLFQELHQKSKYHVPTSTTTSDGPVSSCDAHDSKGRKRRAADLRCDFHSKGNHATSDYRAAKAIMNKAGGSFASVHALHRQHAQ
ncbi:hypothetical protein DFQ28_009481 [Apophysomyces sp. BC1034]|nr:hypothetical protein DFQ28_009481 [Apophysomyces sp. BC1034]